MYCQKDCFAVFKIRVTASFKIPLKVYLGYIYLSARARANKQVSKRERHRQRESKQIFMGWRGEEKADDMCMHV